MPGLNELIAIQAFAAHPVMTLRGGSGLESAIKSPIERKKDRFGHRFQSLGDRGNGRA